MTKEEATLAPVMKFINEGLNQGNGDVIAEVWDEDLLWEGGSLGTVHGLKAFMSGGVRAFSDMHLTILDVTVHGDDVWVQFTNEGTQVGEFMGYPATNKHAKWNGFGKYTVKGGKIIHGWFSEDILAMLKQQGHIA
ncbi:ester cyclase [Furfurilactobacillus entadae]|uniref:ester cyclase n=1 Tax=Furfurilactobacillus entadae TaxID=2922307 RepID=UPI0035ECE6A9